MNLYGTFLGMDIFGWLMIGVLALMLVLGLVLLFADCIQERYESKKAKDKRRKLAYERVMKGKGH